MDLAGKRVTVVGLARSGQAAARLLSAKGAKVLVSETASNPVLEEAAQGLIREGIQVELGGHSRKALEADLLVTSPGVRREAPILQGARDGSIPVWSEIELACRYCPATIVAVTGTNGKTTVTSLIGQLLQLTGRRVFTCGNIGIPFSGEVLKMQPGDLVSLEVSSFQLEHIQEFHPHVAVFLNFTPDHLDRHADLEEYFGEKAKIFSRQRDSDWAVLNFSDRRLKKLAPTLPSQVVYFNRVASRLRLKDTQGRPFLLNPNHLAAMAVGSIFGLSRREILGVFRNFKAVAHRMEYVTSVCGVDFINDSKATNVDSTLWALRQMKYPLVLIAGGRDKKADFTSLRALVSKKVHSMVLIGEAAEKIKQAYADKVFTVDATDIDEAVRTAFDQARRCKGMVLLSPMCASFDMFRDYEDRGERFKQAVVHLKAYKEHNAQ